MEEDRMQNKTDLQRSDDSDREEAEMSAEEKVLEAESGTKPGIGEELKEQRDKYIRLYAEFENYKKRILRDKEELIKYGNESLLYELLPVIDNLEMAIKHSSNDLPAGDQPGPTGLLQGVEITLKEFLRVLEKFGLTSIEAQEKKFDPSLHHAMTQVDRDDIDDNTVVEEFRKGYTFRDKVLRPSLVAVSKKPATSGQASNISEEDEKSEDKVIEEDL